MEKIKSNRDANHRTCRFRRINKEGIRVALEVTHRCNFACKHCFVAKDNIQVPLDELLAVIHQLRAVNCRKVILTGGEPLIRDDLERIINACAAQGILVDLNTNLFDIVMARIEKLINAGMNEVSVSLYGDATIHDAIVGLKGAHQKIVDNIMILRRLNIDVDIHSAIYRNNVESVIEIAEKADCSSLTFFTLIPNKTVEYADDSTRINKLEMLRKINMLSENYTIPINTIGLIDDDPAQCTMCREIIGITAALELKPCLLAESLNIGKKHLIGKDLQASIHALYKEVNDGCWSIGCFKP